jgi:hypothetical protein
MPRRRGIRLPLAVGGSLFALLVLQSALGSVVGLLGYGLEPPTISAMIQGLGQQVGTIFLPFAIGVVASLWIIAPLASELTLVRVLLRAVAASAIGAVFVAVVLIGSRLNSLAGGVGLMSQIQLTGLSAEAAVNLFGMSLGSAAQRFLAATPLVAVVAIFGWSRLPKRSSTHLVFGRARQV